MLLSLFLCVRWYQGSWSWLNWNMFIVHRHVREQETTKNTERGQSIQLFSWCCWDIPAKRLYKFSKWTKQKYLISLSFSYLSMNDSVSSNLWEQLNKQFCWVLVNSFPRESTHLEKHLSRIPKLAFCASTTACNCINNWKHQKWKCFAALMELTFVACCCCWLSPEFESKDDNESISRWSWWNY